MAVTYDLSNTKYENNGELHKDYHDDGVFGFLLYMMVVKVGELDDKGLALFDERIAEYLVSLGKDDKYDYTVERMSYLSNMANDLKGLNTNISTETNTKWKNHLYTLIQERGKKLQQSAAYDKLSEELSSTWKD